MRIKNTVTNQHKTNDKKPNKTNLKHNKKFSDNLNKKPNTPILENNYLHNILLHHSDKSLLVVAHPAPSGEIFALINLIKSLASKPNKDLLETNFTIQEGIFKNACFLLKRKNHALLIRVVGISKNAKEIMLKNMPILQEKMKKHNINISPIQFLP